MRTCTTNLARRPVIVVPTTAAIALPAGLVARDGSSTKLIPVPVSDAPTTIAGGTA